MEPHCHVLELVRFKYQRATGYTGLPSNLVECSEKGRGENDMALCFCPALFLHVLSQDLKLVRRKTGWYIALNRDIGNLDALASMRN